MVEKVASVSLQDMLNFMLDIAYICLELLSYL